jgi:ATP-dependent DNA helicase RecG
MTSGDNTPQIRRSACRSNQPVSPRRHLMGVPGAVAYFSRYDGLNRASPRGDRLELAQTLLEQLRILLPAVEAEAKVLYDKDDLAQPSVLKYPARALREATVNAFAHRDYELVDPLRVTAFLDRIDVFSPGGPPLGVSAEDLNASAVGPRWRNQALAWFLTRLGYAEAEGQGLRTIQASLQESGAAPATFRVDASGVLCTLPAHPRAMR